MPMVVVGRHPARRCAAVELAALALVILAMPRAAEALVGGPAPGSVSSQTLKLPDGPASVQGLAQEPTFDIFTAQVSYSVPFALPAGPAAFGPTLALSYSGDLGNGPVGVGWSLSGIA